MSTLVPSKQQYKKNTIRFRYDVQCQNGIHQYLSEDQHYHHDDQVKIIKFKHDGSTLYTDASEDCSTSPQPEDLDNGDLASCNVCVGFQQACYCALGQQCQQTHLVYNKTERQCSVMVIYEYPEITRWLPRRIRSFLH